MCQTENFVKMIKILIKNENNKWSEILFSKSGKTW